ncbi:MAG: HIT family protein [Gammaproteobacteria bacterium]|nr:HIT family protein [Gammaproteobacteria bacterium]
MPNQTMTRFGYPDTLICEYDHWVVLLREQHVTLGSLILCSSSDATAFSKLSAGAFEEMRAVVNDIERAIAEAFRYDKINYLMLMMADPNVHFHVFPRYATERSACGLTMTDTGWPATPRLDVHRELSPSERDALCRHVRDFW